MDLGTCNHGKTREGIESSEILGFRLYSNVCTWMPEMLCMHFPHEAYDAPILLHLFQAARNLNIPSLAGEDG